MMDNYNPLRGIKNFSHRMHYANTPVRMWEGPDKHGLFRVKGNWWGWKGWARHRFVQQIDTDLWGQVYVEPKD